MHHSNENMLGIKLLQKIELGCENELLLEKSSILDVDFSFPYQAKFLLSLLLDISTNSNGACRTASMC